MIELSARAKPPRWAPFADGFRPFFLLAAPGGAVFVGLWLSLLLTGRGPDPGYAPVYWHAHEMLFGYSAAAVAGFLLTFVHNWTGIGTITGRRLVLMAAIWLAGRVAAGAGSGLPPLLAATVDLAFLPVLAATVWAPVYKGTDRWLRIFPLLLAAMSAANLAFHLDVSGALPGAAGGVARGALLGSLFVLLYLIAVIGGHIFPMFTARQLGVKVRVRRRVEQGAKGSLALLGALAVTAPHARLTVLAALAAAVLHAVRMAGWYAPGIWRVPLLWVLYLGYGWIIAGCALTGLSALGAVSPSIAVHAFAVGGIGTLTLGLMARVTLGHTGRPVRATAPLTLSFLLITGAAAGRVLGPLLWPGRASLAVTASGLLWIAAALLFCAPLIPALLLPEKTPQ